MLKATYFDGQTTRRHNVSVTLSDGFWNISGGDIERHDAFAESKLAEKIGNAPRQLHFADGAYCQIADHAALEAMLLASGYQPHSVVSKWEGKWRYALLAVVLIAAFFAASYQWALPWAAKVIAQKLPASVPTLMDKQTLATFDGYILAPSELPPARQESLAEALAAIMPAEGDGLPRYQLVFRKSEAIGPNAFALPGGTVLMTDELVTLADRSPNADAQIIGVLTHELGHVYHQHALRNFVQGSIVAAVVTWYLGDVSSLLAAAPIALLNTRYTRDFEREADRYAADTMLKNGMSPAHLADMLESMQTYAYQNATEGTEPENPGSQKQGKQDDKRNRWADYFSTHPNTDERMAKLRNWSGKGAAQ
ncbi:MAG: M48 family metallopeptidase [Methylophilaceae bacterium]|nr:M48 family metallopeptidase [Methylophilaceae bacterium]